MKKYVGTEEVHAKPMTRGTYNTLRGWIIPEDENPLDEGYVVERRDVGHANWIPKDLFENIYSEEVVNTRTAAMVDLKHDLLTGKYTRVRHEKDFNFNAPHHFEVYADRGHLVGNVHFQEGPVKEAGVNGVMNEDLIAMVICRIEHFNRSEFSCRENSMAITKLEEALLWLRKRTMGRDQRGVEGTYTK